MFRMASGAHMLLVPVQGLFRRPPRPAGRPHRALHRHDQRHPDAGEGRQRPRHGGVDPQARSDAAGRADRGRAGLKGYDANTNGGFLAPAGTPKAIVDKLNAEINAALKLPDVRAKLEAAGIEIQGGTPQEYAALIQSDLAKWGKVVKAAGIQPE